MSIPSRTAPGALIGNKFLIERELGRGGMGCVLLVRHQQLRSSFALKVLLPELRHEPRAVKRFLREGRAASAVDSPNVAKIFDVGLLEDGRPYLVMELLRGNDLGWHIATRGRLPAHEAVTLVRQACRGLEAAHGRGLIHRDIKPSNLFVTSGLDGEPVLKVLDFGVSKANFEGESLKTRDSTILGTPRYMAPEQMRAAQDADTCSDIWSLGVVLYELLTGKPPFGGDTLPEVCASVLQRRPRRPSELRPGIPRSLDRIVSRCLERDPLQRFRSAALLSRALEPFEFVDLGERAAATGSGHTCALIALLGFAASLAPETAHVAAIPRAASIVEAVSTKLVMEPRNRSSTEKRLEPQQPSRSELAKYLKPEIARVTVETAEESIYRYGRF